MTQITYPSGRIITYTRDSVGRITDISTKLDSGSSAVTVVSSGAYKPFGPLSGLTFGNSVALTIGYDQDSQLTSIQSSVSSTTIQNLSYGYDNAGNITSITDNYQSARSQTLGYDNLNRLNSASGAYGSLSFTYDGVGNRATFVVGSTTNTYNYSGSANRISTISVSGSTVRSFSYANSGQVSQDVRGGSTTYGFTYNNDGRLASAALNSSTVGSYVYNGLEQRVAKTVSSTTTHYVIDGDGRVMSENDASGNPIREYIWLNSMPVGLVDRTGMSPVLYFIHTDHLNRPQKLTDGSAALLWDAVYQPFGEAYSVSGSATNLLMFPGQFYDSETALAQNWNRDYDATLGRYIQSDPIGLSGGINTYAYVSGNPYGATDPTGECAQCVGGATNVVIGYVIATATGQCYTLGQAAEDFVLGAAGVGLVSRLAELSKLGKVGALLERFAANESGAVGGNAASSGLKHFGSDIEKAAAKARTQPYRPDTVSTHAQGRMELRNVNYESVQEAVRSGTRTTFDPATGAARYDLPASASSTGRAVTVIRNDITGNIITVMDKGSR